MLSYIPEHITINLILTTFLISAVCSIIVGSAFALFEVPWRIVIWQALRNALLLMGFSFPIALVGYISGYLSTMGRSSAVGNVLPAMLSLLAALNLYVFGSENKNRVLISYCICLFAAMLFYGTQYGAYKRDIDQEFRLRELIRTEARLRIIRKNLGLPDDFPSWIIGSEPK